MALKYRFSECACIGKQISEVAFQISRKFLCIVREYAMWTSGGQKLCYAGTAGRPYGINSEEGSDTRGLLEHSLFDFG